MSGRSAASGDRLLHALNSGGRTDTGATFASLDISPERLAAIEALGWTRPTPIQIKAIPSALAGKDVVGIAQTGTGKTGAFMIPTLERIQAGQGMQVLVLCPTRELAIQVCADTAALSKGTSIRSSTIYGGVDYAPQIEALDQGHEVIVATPGRFIDHLGRGRVDMKNVGVLILDEADRMLDMGFRPDIEEILGRMPYKRQTLLFSATMPNGVHALALRISKDALWIEAAPPGTVADGVTERALFVKPGMKPELLLALLEEAGWDQVLVFTRTKIGADRLDKGGVDVEVTHGDRQMRQRTRALDRFTEGQVRVLVATDVAQRGLDVEGITHVVNYDIPRDPEDYVHRIGRTGRAGAEGSAVTFVTAGDLGSLKTIEQRLGRQIPREHLAEFDYAGGEAERPKERRRRTRAGGGIGEKKTGDLSPEELAKLLNFD
jgi:ATP-dependent RNA helicase RhlE